MKLNLLNNSDTPLNIWEIATIKCNFTSNDQLVQLASRCLATTTYHLWDKRNNRIFQNQKLNKIERPKLIQVDLTYLIRWSTAKTSRTSRNVEIPQRLRVDLNGAGWSPWIGLSMMQMDADPYPKIKIYACIRMQYPWIFKN